ncbi:uncharacterized protein PSFLO_00595 [Pseudozyma flocculosa]|uniref:Uncharacterized protein n=1 Tax=Pseudozyma flocculosa TaxID=84751 RepID=A0A5C3ES32_9BASI|nr:uncharacterized protein PSFLO_00595 [Pseudozyma flocculosa]
MSQACAVLAFPSEASNIIYNCLASYSQFTLLMLIKCPHCRLIFRGKLGANGKVLKSVEELLQSSLREFRGITNEPLFLSAAPGLGGLAEPPRPLSEQNMLIALQQMYNGAGLSRSRVYVWRQAKGDKAWIVLGREAAREAFHHQEGKKKDHSYTSYSSGLASLLVSEIMMDKFTRSLELASCVQHHQFPHAVAVAIKSQQEHEMDTEASTAAAASIGKTECGHLHQVPTLHDKHALLASLLLPVFLQSVVLLNLNAFWLAVQQGLLACLQQQPQTLASAGC